MRLKWTSFVHPMKCFYQCEAYLHSIYDIYVESDQEYLLEKRDIIGFDNGRFAQS